MEPNAMIRGMIASAVLLLGLTQTGSAADLSEIYKLSVQNDPQIAAAQAGFYASREAITQARSALLPQVFAGVGTSDNRRHIPVSGIPDVITNFNSNGFQVSISQPVFELASWYQFQRSKNIVGRAEALFIDEQQNLIFRTADAYFRILEAQDLLEASNAEREAVQRQLEQVQQRFDVGLVAITDVLESTAAFDTSTVNVIEAQGAQRISFESLQRLTGRSFENVASLSDQFPVESPEPKDQEAWVKVAIDQNLQLLAGRQAVLAAEKQLKAARSGHLPTVDANVTYNSSSTSGGDFFGAKQDTRSAELRLSVPVYLGGATNSRVREAGHRLDESQRNFDLAQKQVIEQARSLYTAINTDVGRVRARLKGIESSQSALEATETGYEVGTRNIVDVLLVQQRLFEAQFRYAQARYKYITDTLRLKQLAGILSPQDIYDLNQFLESAESVERAALPIE